MSLTSVREAIFNAIPVQLKVAVSVGIGFFIAFIGVQNAHIIVDGATLVSLYSFYRWYCEWNILITGCWCNLVYGWCLFLL